MQGASLPGRPLRQLWAAYETQLARRPVATQIATSAVLWGAGDVLAQRLEKIQGFRRQTEVAAGSLATLPPPPQPPPLSWRNGMDIGRAALTAAFGAALVGPVGNMWYAALDIWCTRLVPCGGAPRIAAKVLIDTAVLGPFYVAAFFTWGAAFMGGGGASGLVTKLQSDFLPTLAAEAAFWPAVQAANFTFTPLRHQLLVVNAVTLLDATFMSWARDQDDWFARVAAWLAAPQSSTTHSPGK